MRHLRLSSVICLHGGKWEYKRRRRQNWKALLVGWMVSTYPTCDLKWGWPKRTMPDNLQYWSGQGIKSSFPNDLRCCVSICSLALRGRQKSFTWFILQMQNMQNMHCLFVTHVGAKPRSGPGLGVGSGVGGMPSCAPELASAFEESLSSYREK